MEVKAVLFSTQDTCTYILSSNNLPFLSSFQGGKRVILHSYVRPHHLVAKATLQTCSPSTIVGDKALGTEFCQVFVNEVLDRKAPLIRPFGAMTTMADALGYSIAWIREKVIFQTPR